MIKINSFIFFFTMALFICQKGFGQMKFQAKLTFPQSIKKDKLQISIDNGTGSKDVSFELYENQITLSDTFYAKFAGIEIRYTNEEDAFHPFIAGFFVSEKPAIIRFIQKDGGKNPIGNYHIENGLDMDNADARQLIDFAAKEDNDFWNCLKANANKFQGNDSIISLIQGKADIAMNKKTEFFKHCSGSYFCLWLFKQTAVYNNTISSDSLLTVYKNAFSESMRQSFEGNEIVKIITGRSEQKYITAPNFIATDVNGKNISLEMFKGSYVLIDFWASWCSPCVKEMPNIKEIREKYSDENLKIIFITQDNNGTSFSNAIIKHKIDFGIHIFSTPDLINLYGAQAIPKTFLIDPNGVIIYNNQIEKDSDLHILNQLLKEKIK